MTTPDVDPSGPGWVPQTAPRIDPLPDGHPWLADPAPFDPRPPEPVTPPQ